MCTSWSVMVVMVVVVMVVVVVVVVRRISLPSILIGGIGAHRLAKGGTRSTFNVLFFKVFCCNFFFSFVICYIRPPFGHRVLNLPSSPVPCGHSLTHTQTNNIFMYVVTSGLWHIHSTTIQHICVCVSSVCLRGGVRSVDTTDRPIDIQRQTFDSLTSTTTTTTTTISSQPTFTMRLRTILVSCVVCSIFILYLNAITMVRGLDFGIPKQYHNAESLHQAMFNLASQYPHLAQVIQFTQFIQFYHFKKI